ncbi:MAG: hypothetical protein AAGF77_12005 [Bacteroidota bacterium]
MAKIKINKLLLSKYYNNSCTHEERKAVEAWLKADNLDELLYLSKKEKIKIKEEIWESIRFKNSLKTERVLLSMRKGFRVAAAACILFVAFLGGRVSAHTNITAPVESAEFQEHLYLFGGMGTHGNLPGEHFRLRFDGTLRLYNASQKLQTIQSGDSLFVLEPNQTYYITGGTKSAELIKDLQVGRTSMTPSNIKESAGSFSILRLDL